MTNPFTKEELKLGEVVVKGVALQRGISEGEVREVMEAALQTMRQDTDPELQALWAGLPGGGESVTVEEFIAYVARLVRRCEQDPPSL